MISAAGDPRYLDEASLAAGARLLRSGVSASQLGCETTTVPLAHARLARRHPTGSLRSASVKTAPDWVTCLPFNLRSWLQGRPRKRRHQLRWLIVFHALVFALDQNIPIPILGRARSMPYVRRHSVKNGHWVRAHRAHRHHISLLKASIYCPSRCVLIQPTCASG